MFTRTSWGRRCLRKFVATAACRVAQAVQIGKAPHFAAASNKYVRASKRACDGPKAVALTRCQGTNGLYKLDVEGRDGIPFPIPGLDSGAPEGNSSYGLYGIGGITAHKG